MPLSAVSFRYRLLVVSLIALAGALTSVFLSKRATAEQEARIQAEFQHRANHRSHHISSELSIYPEIMAQLVSIGSLKESVYWALLQESFEGIVARHSTIAVMEWVTTVRHSNRSRWEASNSRIHERPIIIQQRQPDGTFIPAPAAEYYYPIQSAIPVEGNEKIIGYDLTSAPTWPFLQKARDTGEMVATSQFTLAQQNQPEDLMAVILIMPVYIQNPIDGPPPLRGYLQCVLRVHDTLAQLHRNQSDEALLIYYEDASAAAHERPVLYANFAGIEPPMSNAQTVALPADLDESSPEFFVETFRMGDREWRFIARLNPAWAQAQRTETPHLILGGGLFATLLLSLLVNSVIRRNEQVEREVQHRTRALNETRKLLEQDITQRVVAEKNWRESENLLRGITNNSGSEIFVKDRQGRYILFNRQFEKALRKTSEEIVGRTDDDLFSPEISKKFRDVDQQVIDSREVVRLESDFDFQGKRRVDIVQKFPLFDENGEVSAVGGIVTDITDRAETERLSRELERKFQAGQKMESLGELAGGIAHDFNNILATVLGQASLMRRDRSLKPAHDHKLGLIEMASRRASELCQQMLTYAGQASHESEVFDLNQIITETSKLLSASLPKSVSIKEALLPERVPVEANVTQIRQVVMNLILNASDAISPQLGTVSIRTFGQTFGESESLPPLNAPLLPPGEYIGAEFSDNGAGISAEDLPRVFDPFFTTKAKGRGLGLSTAHGIVQSHGGALTVSSEQGQGSVFTLYLRKATSWDQPPPESPTSPATSQLEGAVLVVDDEAAVRELAVNILELEEIKTFKAADGEEALEVYRAHLSEIVVVLLDLTMPGLTGVETLQKLREIDPDVRVIILSGYGASDPKTNLAGVKYDAYLQKPYEIDNLMSTIYRVSKSH